VTHEEDLRNVTQGTHASAKLFKTTIPTFLHASYIVSDGCYGDAILYETGRYPVVPHVVVRPAPHVYDHKDISESLTRYSRCRQRQSRVEIWIRK